MGPGGGGAMSLTEVRVGQGFDVHRFELESSGPRQLVLGGCVFEGEPALVGHSDADVPAHAIADALLSAAGLGDLGSHFPDTDPRWEGADSLELLAEVSAMVRADGWSVGNASVALVCERPRIAPRRAEMESNLSTAVGAPVSLTGRRAEGLGAIGRVEGIAGFASVVILR